MNFDKICKKLNFSDFRRLRWSFWIFVFSCLSILIFYINKKIFFYNTVIDSFNNYPRFFWALVFSFMGFSFLAFRVSKNFPLDEVEKDKPWKSYIFNYFPRLVALSLIIFSMLHLFEVTSGYLYYFFSAGLGLYFGDGIEKFKPEDMLKKS